jgi:hypothetical protein
MLRRRSFARSFSRSASIGETHSAAAVLRRRALPGVVGRSPPAPSSEWCTIAPIELRRPGVDGERLGSASPSAPPIAPSIAAKKSSRDLSVCDARRGARVAAATGVRSSQMTVMAAACFRSSRT